MTINKTLNHCIYIGKGQSNLMFQCVNYSAQNEGKKCYFFPLRSM